jgi:hypothetical protein
LNHNSQYILQVFDLRKGYINLGYYKLLGHTPPHRNWDNILDQKSDKLDLSMNNKMHDKFHLPELRHNKYPLTHNCFAPRLNKKVLEQELELGWGWE